ncbi:MAG: TetR/AcrR family transcriptional regulator [Candidatus Enterosoma sp.]|nr:TetR/AcrR family transcriptional regulator [bacterium]MDY5548422.1 TetR/AcrR family transcriptional regulator [Candidatus Enterosoma sp.]
MRKEYKNAVESKRKIKQAIYDLIKEKQSIKSITITEIVEKAGINRGTFYNHYKSIPEVLNDIEKDLITSFSKRFDKTYEILSFEEKTKVFFRSLTLFIKENETELSFLLKAIPQLLFTDMQTTVLGSYQSILLQALKEQLPTEENREANLTYNIIASGITSAYLNYLKHTSDYTLEEIEHHIIQLILKLSK